MAYCPWKLITDIGSIDMDILSPQCVKLKFPLNHQKILLIIQFVMILLAQGNWHYCKNDIWIVNISAFHSVSGTEFVVSNFM